MTTRLLPLLLLAFTATAAAEPFGGRQDEGREQARERRAEAHQARVQSLAESVRRVERATGGQILSAETVPFDGRDMNRIKVVDSSGRVRVITEDPQRPRRPRDQDD